MQRNVLLINLALFIFSCISLSMTIVGFVQAYTLDVAMASRGAPTVTAIIGLLGLCLAIEVLVAVRFTKPTTMVKTRIMRTGFYVGCIVCSFFAMIFYGSLAGAYVETYGSVGALAFLGLSCTGLYNLVAVLSSLNQQKDEQKVEDSEKANQKMFLKGCCGVGCCNKSCWGMCCRWTIFISVLLFVIQAGLVLTESVSFINQGLATNGVPLRFSKVYANGAYPVSNPLQLDLVCFGSNSSGYPTILLESGGGAGWTSMYELMQDLRTHESMPLRVCSYDRAGYGFSQSGNPKRSTNLTIQEVFETLQYFNESGPFICAGHSVGGEICRAHQAIYPSKIVGLIMLDAYCNNGDCNIEAQLDLALGKPSTFDKVASIRLSLVDLLRFTSPLLLTRMFLSHPDITSANYGGNMAWNAQYIDFRAELTSSSDDEFSEYLWWTANNTNVPLYVIGAGVNDTCEQQRIPVSSSNCEEFLNRSATNRVQMDLYAKTSPLGKVLYCTNGCTHGFVWEKASDVGDYIRQFVLEYF